MDAIALYHRVSAFLFHEARLMDEHRFDEWLALWTQEGHYWIPCNADDVDRSRHISLVNEDWFGLKVRIARLKSTTNYAQKPYTRTAHLIGNIEVEADPDRDSLVVHSVQNITAYRRGTRQTVSGRVRHHLQSEADGFAIRAKKVTLVDNDEAFGNLAFLI